jgi:hypothetical protein
MRRRGQRPELRQINLSSGSYPEVETNDIGTLLGEVVIPDPDNLLDKILHQRAVTGYEHAMLLKKLIDLGYTTSDKNFGVGPVRDSKGKTEPNKMRVVQYLPRLY